MLGLSQPWTLSKSAKIELSDLEASLFYLWMKELKTALELIIVPAVIDGQSLPGFKTEDTSRSIKTLFKESMSYDVGTLLRL